MKNRFRCELDISNVGRRMFNGFIILNALITIITLIACGLLILNIFYIGDYNKLSNIKNYLEFATILLCGIQVLILSIHTTYLHKKNSKKHADNTSDLTDLDIPLVNKQIEKNRFSLNLFKILINPKVVGPYLLFINILLGIYLILLLTGTKCVDISLIIAMGNTSTSIALLTLTKL